MKTFKSILSAVLSVIIFISGFVFIAAGILNYTLFNVNFYTSRITDNEYSDILYNSVSEEINKRINTIQISQEGVMSVIDKNELNRMSERDVYKRQNTAFRMQTSYISMPQNTHTDIFHHFSSRV